LLDLYSLEKGVRNMVFDYPRVGLAAIILNREERVLLGLRKGSHGAGTWSFPGGALEIGETFDRCIEREVREETGLNVTASRPPAHVTNDYFPREGKHYVTIFVRCDYQGGQPQLREPEKCEAWKWYRKEGLPSLDKLFLPVQKIVAEMGVEYLFFRV